MQECQQEQELLQKQQQEEQERLLQQKRLEEEKLENQKENHTPARPTPNGDVTRTRVRRRHVQAPRKPPSPTFVAPPVIHLSNGDVSTVLNKAEIETPKIIQKSEIISVSAEETPNRSSLGSTPTCKEPKQNTDVMTTNQKLLMDMIYANQAVASKQVESDEGSDEAGSIENETSETSVSVKDMASKLQSIDISNRLKPPTSEEDVPPVAAPPVVKKDSDIMWEKLIDQSCHVSFYLLSRGVVC